MPVARASSQSSLAKGGTEHALGEGHAGVAAFKSQLHRTLANEAEFWLSSERDYVGRRRLGGDAKRLEVKGR